MSAVPTLVGAPTPEPLTVADLVTLHHQLTERASEIAEQLERVKAELRERLDLGRTATPAGTVTLSPNRRFDPALAERVLGEAIAGGHLQPDQVAACWKRTLDSGAVKRVVPPALYEECMRDAGQPKMSVTT